MKEVLLNICAHYCQLPGPLSNLPDRQSLRSYLNSVSRLSQIAPIPDPRGSYSDKLQLL